MPSRYPLFDRAALTLLPLDRRVHDLSVTVIEDPAPTGQVREPFAFIAERLAAARSSGAARVLMMGAHVLRRGMQRYLFDLMESGCLDLLAVNGACVIHDFEFALIGATTESVARYIQDGQFGLWQETGYINDIVTRAREEGLGLGEAVGRAVWEGDFPHKADSLLARAWSLGIPVTVHVGIGCDIIHEHPNFDGAAYGETSYRDFLIFTQCLTRLTGGVVMNFGSAVMAPEVFLKALAMVRNAARGQGRGVGEFATLVCDVRPLPETYAREAPKSDPNYYFRPWKTMLVRSLGEGGQSRYVQGDHAATVPELWTALSRLGVLGERPHG
jgi:hypothetical protein